MSPPRGHGNLPPELLAPRMAASPTKQRALAAGDDPVAAAGDGLRYERRRAGVADFGSAHGDDAER
jgi:hypothetical protein